MAHLYLYKGWHTNNATCLFLNNYSYSCKKIYIYHEYMCFTELTLHFPKSSSLPPHFFPLLLAIVYASHVKLFAEASELFTHAVFQLVIVCKMASLECILQGAKKMVVGGRLNQYCREDEGKQSAVLLNCLPCAQTGVWSGIVLQEEFLIHITVCPSPSNSLF